MISDLESIKLGISFPRFSADSCSIDNDFAAIVKTGVHIVSFRPNIRNNYRNKYWTECTFIQTPTHLPLSNLPLDFDSLDREKFCILSLNPKLTPVEKCLDPPKIYVKHINWGFFRDLLTHRPVIGILTNHGCLQLFTFNRIQWIQLVDLSIYWKQHCLKNGLCSVENTFDHFLKTFELIRIVAFTWCIGFRMKDSHSPLLLSVSQSGVIAIWKITGNTLKVQTEIIKTTKTSLKVHNIVWHEISEDEGYAIISNTDGTVFLYSCKKSAGSEDIEFKITQILWSETDHILCENVKVKKYLDNYFLILSKEHCVVSFQFQPGIISSHVFEFHKRVAGIEFTDECNAFVILTNAECFTVDCENVTRQPIPVHCSMSTNLKNHRCNGLAFSRNKEFCVLSMNIAKFHDHLKLKNAWLLLLCWMNKEVTLGKLQSFVAENRVHEAYDIVESFRIQCTNKKIILDNIALLSVWKYLNDDLQICRRILQIMWILLSGCKLSQNEENTIAVEVLLNICNYRWLSMRREKDAREKNLFFSWLRSNLKKIPKFLNDYKFIKDAAADLQNNPPARIEKCGLCSIDIKSHESWRRLICENGHKILRCSYTFLPILLHPYKECPFCHSVAIETEGMHECVICDTQF